MPASPDTLPTDATASDPPIRDVVAIDGPSGAGKSTVARTVARRLGFSYLDTGAMYRAVTLHLLRSGHDVAGTAGSPGGASLETVLDGMQLQLTPDGRALLGGEDVSEALRSRDVESRVSAVAALSEVRARMRSLQRAIARRGPTVAEGRDMGSVVFPHSRWKFYLDADLGERASRRRRDFEGRGRDVAEGTVLDELQERDRLDSGREDAPLVRVPDAVYVDSTGLSVEQVVGRVLQVVGEARGAMPARFSPWVYPPSRFAAWLLGRLWLRLQVDGREHVPATGPFVLVSNHQSGVDPLVLGVGVPQKVVFLARSTLRRWPLMGWWMGRVGTIPIDREAPGRRAIDAMIAVLHSGQPLALFPEGTRSRDGAVGPFRRGLSLILKRCPVPVVPAGLRGTMAALPRGRFLPRPARCEMRIGAPMQAGEVLAPDGLERLRRRVAELASAPVRAAPEPGSHQVGAGPDPARSDDP